MLLNQSAILALETAKYWNEGVSPLLIWTLPVQCRNCFSLFKFVPRFVFWLKALTQSLSHKAHSSDMVYACILRHLPSCIDPF